MSMLNYTGIVENAALCSAVECCSSVYVILKRIHYTNFLDNKLKLDKILNPEKNPENSDMKIRSKPSSKTF